MASAVGGVVLADHSWENYHWARTTDDFKLIVVDSTTADWAEYVDRATRDWSDSPKLDMVLADGSDSDRDRRQCGSPAGAVRICNQAYGNTGWLGIAGISIDGNGHIVTGYTKLNDWYFSQDYYKTRAWKQSVTCQELGHNIGLDHQDEDFNNTSLQSCMDYQVPPFPVPQRSRLRSAPGHLWPYRLVQLIQRRGRRRRGRRRHLQRPSRKGLQQGGRWTRKLAV